MLLWGFTTTFLHFPCLHDVLLYNYLAGVVQLQALMLYNIKRVVVQLQIYSCTTTKSWKWIFLHEFT